MSETKQGYPAEAIANFFIEKAKEDKGVVMTHLKLQKLTYIAHGWCLGLHKHPLIDEAPQAWRYGPVIKSLYHALKHYGPDPIKKPIALPAVNSEDNIARVPAEDTEILELLEAVWEAYKGAKPGQLVAATHKDDTPWAKVYKPGVPNTPIDNGIIQRYYEKLAEANKNKKKAAA